MRYFKTPNKRYRYIYILIYTQQWNSNAWVVVILLNNNNPNNCPEEMTQYCYFHTPANNRLLKSNCSVCGVVAVRISFFEINLLLHKWSVSLHCLTLLHFGSNRFKCSGKRQVAGTCRCGDGPSASIICRELLA